MRQSLHVTCFSVVRSPVTHNRGVVGNESVINREQTVDGHWVPTLSGNSLRHRLVREPGSRFLIESLGLRGKLTIPQLCWFFNGGVLSESTGREDTGRIAEVKRLLPLFRLLGGSFPDQIFPGEMIVDCGALVCEENRELLRFCLPKEWPLPTDRLRSAEAMVGSYQYVRGRTENSAGEFLPEDEAAVVREQRQLLGTAEELADQEPQSRGGRASGKSAAMLMSGQQVNRGAAFVHGFWLPDDPLALGALLCSLQIWRAKGSTVGGSSARGHGKLETWIHAPTDTAGLVDAYIDHVKTHVDECVQFVLKLFREKKIEEKKTAKGKKK